MSFSSDVKGELCALENKRACCLHAECYGMWLFSKCFSLKETVYSTENGFVARRMAELAAIAAGVSADMSFGLSRRKKQAYRITFSDVFSKQTLLKTFGHTGLETSLRLNRGNLENSCCVAAFLRGAFLSCGTATDPKKEYHLEFSGLHKNLAYDLLALLKEMELLGEGPSLTPAVTVRKGSYVLYLKESGQLEDFLTYVGAPSASMELMQIKMYKEAKNNINRKTNFETANMDKTYSASARQTAAIAIISDTVGLKALPEDLQELASLRLMNPEMTLRELALRLHISRSGVNHRLQRILQLGEKLVAEKGIENIM